MEKLIMVGKKPFIIEKIYKNGKMVLRPKNEIEDLRGNLDEFTYEELMIAALQKSNEEKVMLRDSGLFTEMAEDAYIENIINSVLDK